VVDAVRALRAGVALARAQQWRAAGRPAREPGRARAGARALSRRRLRRSRTPLEAALAREHAGAEQGAELWALLGWCLERLGNVAEAKAATARALALAPLERSALALAQHLAEREGRREDALAHARACVDAAPSDPSAHYNLGLALAHFPERASEASSCWRRVLALAPDYWPALLSLGQSALARGDYAEAVQDFQAVVTIAAQVPEAWLWLGLAELRRGRGDDALLAFERVCLLNPGHADAWRGVAEASELLGRRDQAQQARERELALRPEHAESHWEAAAAYARFGRDDEARAAIARAQLLAPDRLLPRWLAMQLLPHLYRDAAEQAEWRARWVEQLAWFERLPLEGASLDAQLQECLFTATNFALHYGGGALREEQARYGGLLTRWARHCHPALERSTAPRGSGRLRVGFASAHLRPHTISKLFGAWADDLDRARFEVIAIDLGRVGAGPAPPLAVRADTRLGPHDRIEHWHATLLGAGLDALIWLDIGMDGTTQALAPLRWAPVQCVAWGHPVTTGLEAIDYFLSGELMEPDHAEAQYTERLVCLPGLGIRYPFPERARNAARTTRPEGQAPVLLCTQSIYKLTPVHYALFARLARALPEARFEFTPNPSPELDVGEALAGPFRAAFRAEGQDFDARATVHPFLDQAGFSRRSDAPMSCSTPSAGPVVTPRSRRSLPACPS
jgi:predicted O-linked N-acetylglucosamine transferase (SPINDLY family)